MLVDTRPPGAWEARLLSSPDLLLRRASAATIEQAWSGFATTGWSGVIDGARFVVERGVEGDHRFVHGAAPDPGGAPSPQTRAIHHLSADAGVLQLAPSDPSSESWWRVVLDSVLFTVALLQGHEALHAAAIATPSGVIAILAASGGGKSTLLAELLGRGHALMADDVLALDSREAGPALAHPAPPLMTVPATMIGQLGDAAAARAIVRIDDECWIGVPVHPKPLPMRALVLLDRDPSSPHLGRPPSLTKIENPLASLLDSLMSFPKEPERERARFELASVLAGEAGLWRLAASPEAPPSLLADVLLAGGL